MIGAIIGDIFGSQYEFLKKQKKPRAQEFTDDTVLTIAVMDSLINKNLSFADSYKKYYKLYKDKGYGKRFKGWAESNSVLGYDSLGNGGAMRVSPIAYYSKSIEEVLELSKESAIPTHNHLEGIEGTQIIALSIFLAKQKYSKKQIKEEIEKRFSLDLNKEYNDLEESTTLCNNSIINSLICFFESTNLEHGILLAISLGGDTDTVASMTSAINEAFYERDLMSEYEVFLNHHLDEPILLILNEFKQNIIKDHQ